MAHPAFAELIRSQDARSFSAHYPFNVSPVTDNAPFFFFTLKPEQVFRGLNRGGIDWKVNLGIAILGLVLVISVGAVLAFLVVPMLLSSEARSGRSVRLLYFIAIGLGYILVEIAFIQRFVLFLGNPTYALTVVIFLMLLSSGLGSVFSRRWFNEPTRVASAMAFIVAALVIYVFALPHLLEALVGLPFIAKLLLSALLLIPPGFAMGMPFPSGLRALSGQDSFPGTVPTKHGAVEWAWAMNAASSVLGSVLAMVIAIQFGLNITLACGAVAYVLAMLLLRTFKRQLRNGQLANTLFAVKCLRILLASPPTRLLPSFFLQATLQGSRFGPECAQSSFYAASNTSMASQRSFMICFARKILRRLSPATCTTVNPPCYNHSLG